MLEVLTSRSFRAVTVSAIHMVSCEAMLAYVMMVGALVICPHATSRTLRTNPSIFTVKIMWHCIHWYPGEFFSMSSRVLKAIRTFCISFCIASRQKVIFVSSSISKAHLTDFGILNPNLWVILRYRRLTAVRILSFFFVTYGTHQEKAGSPLIPLSIAYWATSIRYDSFRSARHSQVDVPSFHRTHSFQPVVVF